MTAIEALQAISFRPITDEDLSFLRELYASTRREEMAQSGWPRPQIENFLGEQFRAQHKHYMEAFRNADFDIIGEATAEALARTADIWLEPAETG